MAKNNTTYNYRIKTPKNIKITKLILVKLKIPKA